LKYYGSEERIDSVRDYSFISKKIKGLFLLFSIMTLSFGCATIPEPIEYTLPYTPGYGVYIDHIIMEALEDDELVLSGPGPETFPPYYDRLFEDGRLTVALCIGTEDLVNNFYDETGGGDLLRMMVERYIAPINVYGREIIVDAVVVDNKEEMISALGEREVVFVYSHSRYGNGWALHEDGLDEPFRMQSDPISIPKKHMHNYQAEIVYESSTHYHLAPNTEDIDKVVPYPGFQIIVGLSCTSKRHFMKELLKMRDGNPSLMILTVGAGSFIEMRYKIFKRFFSGIVTGEPMGEIVSGMNDVWQKIPDDFYEEYGIRYNWKPRRVIELSYSDI
jgi:hypothetical protein